MRIDIVTLFPELCDGFLSTSILGRARAKNLFEAHCHQIRDYTLNKQKQVDDYPYGGGHGAVMQADPLRHGAVCSAHCRLSARCGGPVRPAGPRQAPCGVFDRRRAAL